MGWYSMVSLFGQRKQLGLESQIPGSSMVDLYTIQFAFFLPLSKQVSSLKREGSGRIHQFVQRACRGSCTRRDSRLARIAHYRT